MADGVGHLVNRSGRDQARIAVPKDLGDAIGKTEPRRPLGGDYRLALRLVPGAVAHPQREIAVAGRKAKANDVLDLIAHVRQVVAARNGIELELAIEVW